MKLVALLACLALASCAPSPAPAPSTAGKNAGGSNAAAQPVAVATPPGVALPAPQPAVNTDPIEVCFVLDTTGSMGGLIEGAKQKIWSVANQIVKDNPHRPLKIALVPYRDRGDEYITRVIDLTDDLDNMYKELMAFKATGGGDEPESVNQAIQDAVEKVSWSKVTGGAHDATRLLFLVGDAPPHMDYQDDVKYPVTLQKAVKMNIIVNTIQCGSIAATGPIWKDIARSGEGTYLALSQTGNMVAISAPEDKKLLELNAELAKTVVPYGTRREQAEVASKASSFAGMAPEAAAARASYNNATGGRAVQGKGDLVNDIQGDKDALKNAKAEELPAEMQKMTADERKAYVDGQLAKRQQINDEIAKVTKERDAYVKAENERLAGKGDSFDQKVGEIIHEEANRRQAGKP